MPAPVVARASDASVPVDPAAPDDTLVAQVDARVRRSPANPTPDGRTVEARVVEVHNTPSNMLEFVISMPTVPEVTTRWTGRFIDDAGKEIGDSDFTIITVRSRDAARCRVTKWMASIPSELVRLHDPRGP